MHLAETTYDNTATGCCAPVDPARFDEQTWVWTKKPFLKDHIRSFLHLPLNFGSVIGRDQALIEDAAAWPEVPLWLTDEVSPWGADIYVATDRDLPGATMEHLSGEFVSKVFHGPYRDVRRWIDNIESFVAGRQQRIHRLLFFYATCPACAKKLGRNDVVVFAQVA